MLAGCYTQANKPQFWLMGQPLLPHGYQLPPSPLPAPRDAPYPFPPHFGVWLCPAPPQTQPHSWLGSPQPPQLPGGKTLRRLLELIPITTG